MIKGTSLESYIADFENKARELEAWEREHHPDWIERGNEYRDVKGLLEELQTLRRKAEPVQPVAIDKWHERDECPECGNHLYIDGAYIMKYCCDCGQAIDWSKE